MSKNAEQVLLSIKTQAIKQAFGKSNWGKVGNIACSKGYAIEERGRPAHLVYTNKAVCVNIP